jgi:hypothetical protein
MPRFSNHPDGDGAGHLERVEEEDVDGGSDSDAQDGAAAEGEVHTRGDVYDSAG